MNAKEKKLISRSWLFKGLSSEDLEIMLGRLGTSEAEYAQWSILQYPGRPMEHFGFVLSGTVQVYRDEPDGTRLLMASNGPGGSFGESLCYLEVQEVPVTITAASDCRVLWLKMDAVRKPENDEIGRDIVSRVMAGFAQRALNMNDRIQILSQRTLKKKIMTYLMQLAAEAGSNTFNVNFSREDMAVFLGCDRSALCRVLASMKDEGLIDYYLKTFKVKNYE